MKRPVRIRLTLLCVCSVAQTASFSTHVGHRHASIRAKTIPQRRPLPSSSLTATRRRRRQGAPREMGEMRAVNGASSEEGERPSLVRETLAGTTVAFSLLSKAIACSSMVGVNPLVGIWSSVVMGITAPLIGARDGVISGTAAVVVVPLSTLTLTHGVEYMTLCVLVSAIMQGLFGFFRLARTADLVSDEVLNGFLNGLGFILLLSQASVFRAAAATGALVPCISMAALCFSVVQLLPLFTRAVPSSLAGLAAASAVGGALKLPLATLSSTAAEGTFSGGLSSLPRLVDLGKLKGQATSPAALRIVMPAAISITIIALVETLLAGKVVDDMTGQRVCTPAAADETVVDVPTRSVLAMSAGNVASSLLGGFGGCGLIPQTVLNLKSGGSGPISSMSYAIAMASFVVLLAPLVGRISEAALAGIMIAIAFDTVSWGASIRAVGAAIRSSRHPDANGRDAGRARRAIELLALGITSCVCFFGNLAVGIVAGVVIQRGLLSIYAQLGHAGSQTRVEGDT